MSLITFIPSTYSSTLTSNLPVITVPSFRPAYLSPTPLIRSTPPTFQHLQQQILRRPALHGAGQPNTSETPALNNSFSNYAATSYVIPRLPPATTVQPSSAQQDLSIKRIFVGRLSQNTNEDNLHTYFSLYGKVVQVQLIKDRNKKSRGFGFVMFESGNAVNKVLLKDHHMNGKKLKIERAIPKDKHQQQHQGNNGYANGDRNYHNKSQQQSSSGCMRRGRGHSPSIVNTSQSHRSNPYSRHSDRYNRAKSSINIYIN